MSEDELTAHFLMAHGQNTSKRIVPDLLGAMELALNDHGIIYQGKRCTIRTFTPKQREDGTWYLMFDVIEPDDTFHHIEFCITQTGWERS